MGSIIHIEGCQVKSLEKAKKLASALDVIEKECGIRVVEISFKDVFVCPDIDLSILANSKDPMEALIGRVFIKIDIKKYGKQSPYKKINAKP